MTVNLEGESSIFSEIPGGTEKEDEKVTEGRDRPVYTFDDRHSVSDDFDWRTKLRTDLITYVERFSEQSGYPKFALESMVRSSMDGMLGFLTQNIIGPNRQSNVSFDGDVGTVEGGGAWRPQTAQDWNSLWNAGLLYLSQQTGVNFTSGFRGAGGGGSRGPSAADIRNSFDLDELTEAVKNMWGSYLFEDAPQARSIAKSYVDTVVAGGGEKKIDFQTFVLGKIRGTSRHKQIYRNKPEGVEEGQYIGPYVSMTDAVVGGGAGQKQLRGSLIAGGAALGASADAFGQRLQRTDAYRNSNGFIRGLEDRVRDVKNVLRG